LPSSNQQPLKKDKTCDQHSKDSAVNMDWLYFQLVQITLCKSACAWQLLYNPSAEKPKANYTTKDWNSFKQIIQ